jgi:hypothetical protein
VSSAEKGIAAVLVVILVAMVGVYLVTGNKAQSAPAAGNPLMAKGPAGAAGGAAASGAAASGAACATAGAAGGAAAKTEELGKAGAKLDIVAIVPVAHGCHATSIAELKKAYHAHPNDIHLTIVDFFGPDAKKYQSKAGGVTWTVIAINGKSDFELNGRRLVLQKQEGMSYLPADLGPIIGNELKKG